MSELFDPQIADDPNTQAKVRRWIEALRSGRYQQGRGALRPTKDTYCCLGVAVDLLDPDSWIEAGDPDWADFEFENTNGPVEYGAHTDGDICLSGLPAELTMDLYMDSDGDGQFVEAGATGNLARVNDSGIPFAQIADIIERELAEAVGS